MRAALPLALAACTAKEAPPEDTGEPALPTCGDGIEDDGEWCDDGDTDDFDACANDCTPTEPFQGFDAVVQDLLETWGVPGAAVAVTRDERLVLVRAYGLADADTGRPVMRRSRFRVASLSKAVTAAGVLKLVEEGRLSLDEPLFARLDHLPSPSGSDADPRLADVTVRHALHHSGGWDRDLSGDPMFRSQEICEALEVSCPAEPEAVLRWMRDQPLDHDPGTTYAYSNFGYSVLGRVIEAVTGEDYEAWTQREVLAPMGVDRMEIGRSRPEDRPADEVAYHPYPGQADGRSVFPDGPDRVPWPDGGFYQEGLDSHGGWIADVVDLTRFVTGTDGRPGRPDLLSAATTAVMIARPDLAVWQDAAAWYAMGWLVRPTGADANWWHTGSLPGTGALMVRSGQGYTWVVLVNTRPEDANGFFSALDRGMWEALGAVGDWPGYDLFPRYE